MRLMGRSFQPLCVQNSHLLCPNGTEVQEHEYQGCMGLVGVETH